MSLFGFLKKKPSVVITTNNLKLEKMLESKIPSESVSYVMTLWKSNPFNFTISRARKTCLGNYRFKNQQHFISVNGDSNPFSFLITLIHEIAHQHVTLNNRIFRKKTDPHGVEWKDTFRNLMHPLLTEEVFPEDILAVLKRHMINPAASSTRDPRLFEILENYSNKNTIEGPKLSELADGKVFLFKDRKYRKLENRRTRTLVECTVSKKRYTISSFIPIQIMD